MGRRGGEFGSPGIWSGSHPAFNLWAQTGRALLELCFHGNTVYVIYIHVSAYASRLCKYFFKLFCISPELTCFWSVHADLKIKATDQYPLKQRFREMDYLLWKPLERINWHHWGLENYYPVNQRRHRWDVPRNSCLVDFSFLTSAIGLMWCAGNNPICIFDESHFQKSFGHMFFGGVECLCTLQRLWSAVFAKRNSIYFSSFSQKWFGSGISESPLSLLRSLLFAQGPLRSDSKGHLLYKSRLLSAGLQWECPPRSLTEEYASHSDLL